MGYTQQDHDALEDRLLDFAARCGKAASALPNGLLSRHIAGQLVRSGTAPAAQYAEACAAESRADFVHKLGIALKELRESRVWLKLCLKAGLVKEHKLSPLIDECSALMRILAKSILTAKANRRQEREHGS